ncbi:MAG: GFA family protein [Hyphomonadaceae bacterium]
MKIEGGCYCGAVRYEAEGEPTLRAQCYCRECQYIAGGGPNTFMLMPLEGFRYTKGAPSQFARADIENPYTREFCSTCGTHLVTRRADLPAIVIKAGTLDDPRQFGLPAMALFTGEKQPFHIVPEGVRSFERSPQRG